MATDEEKNEGETVVAPPPAGKGKLIALIVGGVILLLVAVGVPTALLLMKKSDAETAKLAANAAGEDAVHPEGFAEEEEYDENEEPIGAIYPLQTFVVNLAENNTFLRCQVQLEFVGQAVPKRFYVRQVPIRDAILNLLASRKPSELASESGKENLKSSIKDLVNEGLKREEVKQVYFTQFVMQ